MSFVAARNAFNSQVMAKRMVHPDCLEIEFSNGARVLQDTTTVCTAMYVSPDNKEAPPSVIVNARDDQHYHHPLPTYHATMNQVLDLCKPLNEIGVDIDQRYIPSYLCIIDAIIKRNKNFLFHINKMRDNDLFDSGYYNKSEWIIRKRIKQYKQLREQISCGCLPDGFGN